MTCPPRTRVPLPRLTHLVVAAVVATVAALAGGGAATAEPGDRAEIEACLERRLPNRTSIQRIAFEVSDGEGEVSRSRAKIHWKRFDDDMISVLIRFSEPPRRAGMAMLARQQRAGKPETYLYLPELRQTRRVSARSAAGSMFGTDFSYEDFAFLQGVADDDNAVRLEDAEIEGRPVYVMESRESLTEEPSYERILYYIERERCAPLRAEFYEPGEKLRKVLEVEIDSIQAYGERFIPMRSTMRDLELKTRTAVEVISIEPDAEIRDRLFEPGRLEVGAR